MIPYSHISCVQAGEGGQTYTHQAQGSLSLSLPLQSLILPRSHAATLSTNIYQGLPTLGVVWYRRVIGPSLLSSFEIPAPMQQHKPLYDSPGHPQRLKEYRLT